LNLRTEGLCFAGAGEGPTGTSPRTPFVVSQTCKLSPAGHEHRQTDLSFDVTRTVSPSLHPRPASGGATDFLLASALSCSPTGLATSRWRRRSMRPTDVCHPNDLRAPAPLAFPAPRATFAAGSPHGVLGSAWQFRGPGRFTTSSVASADRFQPSRNSSLLPYGLLTRAWAFSSHGDVAIEPLTPLSRPFVHPPPRSLSRALHRRRSLAPVTKSVRTGRRMRLAAETTVVAAP
jgi:hypothetical protein